VEVLLVESFLRRLVVLVGLGPQVVTLGAGENVCVMCDAESIVLGEDLF
jgi:hypothetical protein